MTSVDPLEISLTYGYIPLSGIPSASGKPPAGIPVYSLINRSDKVSEITVEGSGKDGALPLPVLTRPITADIHWKLKLKISSRSNPLKPEIEFEGKHDRYPSYEIIVMQSDLAFKDIHRAPANVGDLPGPVSLSSSNAKTVGRSDLVAK